MSHISASHRFESKSVELSPVVEANRQDEAQKKKWTHNRMGKLQWNRPCQQQGLSTAEVPRIVESSLPGGL